ncbi:MAG: class I SAM-dependent methyltransferase [Gaiellaceae bacterium]
MKVYYDRRARKYDDWLHGVGLYADRDRPDWDSELDSLLRTLEELPPARTLDVACGTGFFTRHLPGEVVGLDQSENMLVVAREQAPVVEFVLGDALELPFEDGSFERVATGHFYGHLEDDERMRFLSEARRVAPELLVVDSAFHDGVERDGWQERLLEDGSRWQVYKRFFEPDQLVEELGGGNVLFAGRWFVVVASP